MMKNLYTLLAALLLTTICTQAQFEPFPNSANAGDFVSADPTGALLFATVDPSVLPNQNSFFEEVISVNSGAWNDPSTWTCACVPDDTKSVTVTADHVVTIEEDKAVYTLHIGENATLEVLSAVNITVSGDIAVYGAITGESKDLTLSGVGVQAMLGNCHFDKLYSTQSNDIVVNGNLFISDELWVGSSNFNTNDNLYLVNSDGNLGELAPIFNGSISGDINISKDITITQDGWISLSSPVTDANISTIVQDFTTTGFPGADFPTYPFVSVNYYVEESDDITTDYAGVSNASDAMVVGRGYYVYALAGNYVFNVSGEPTVGNVELPVDFTNNADPDTDGLNLVANPYASTINWDSEAGWNKENMVGAVYVWDVSQKQFRTYINGLGVNGGTAFIKPMESFWVMASGANPELEINEAAKSLHTDMTQESSQNMTVSLTNGIWSDQLVLTTNENASLSFDPTYDALKFYGDNVVPNICTLSDDGVKLAINNVPEFESAEELSMMINIPVAGDFTLSFDGVSNYVSNQCLAVEDLLTGEIYDLHVTDEVTFSSEVVTDEIRFIFHIGAPVTAEATNISCSGDAAGTINTQGSGDGPWDYVWYDADQNMLGETLEEDSNFIISDLSAGAYYVQIQNNDFCGSLNVQVEITEPEEPLDTFDQVYGINCGEDNTGEILVNVFGGVQPYDIQWDNEMVGANIEDLTAGNYTYTLTDGVGCVRSATLEVVEAPDVTVDFMADVTTILLDSNNEAVVNFTNTSEGTTEYSWNFGDGLTESTEENPVHTFTQPGFYTVSLYATNGECDDYHQAVIVVEQFDSVEEIDLKEMVNIHLAENQVHVGSSALSKEEVNVEIYDLLGKVIDSKRGVIGGTDRITLNLDQANALYIVSVTSIQNGAKTTKKISRF